MTDWQNRIIDNGETDPEELLANPANWRLHPDEQQGILEGALEEIGWLAPVIVNQRTGHIVDGHLRVLIAQRNGARVPVSYVDLDENEEAVALASLDTITALAAQDENTWRALIEQLRFDDHNLQEWAAGILGPITDKRTTTEDPDGPGPTATQWGVFIECEDEPTQASIYEELAAEGYDVKVVNT